jgi:hypothetical protein
VLATRWRSEALDGLTRGQRLVVRNDLLGLLTPAALLALVLVAVRRADRDRLWRGAAWTATVVVLVAPLTAAV